MQMYYLREVWRKSRLVFIAHYHYYLVTSRLHVMLSPSIKYSNVCTSMNCSDPITSHLEMPWMCGEQLQCSATAWTTVVSRYSSRHTTCLPLRSSCLSWGRWLRKVFHRDVKAAHDGGTNTAPSAREPS